MGKLSTLGVVSKNRSRVCSSKKVFRVLSLCGGMGTVGYALAGWLAGWQPIVYSKTVAKLLKAA